MRKANDHFEGCRKVQPKLSDSQAFAPERLRLATRSEPRRRDVVPRRISPVRVGYRPAMTIRLAVLGDSIGAGQGASHPSEALSSRLEAGLADHDIETTTRVFAISGAGSNALRGQVARTLGWGPDVAVIVIGANDLTRQTPPGLAARQLGQAVRRLRADGVEVVVAPAPDLSVVPHVPPALRAVVRAASMLLRDHQIRQVTTEGGRVADPSGLTSDEFASDLALFSSDQFHPSSAGYAVIAESLLPLVLDAARLAASKPATGTVRAAGTTGLGTPYH
jgi:lysophospholipase L1-like esterase